MLLSKTATRVRLPEGTDGIKEYFRMPLWYSLTHAILFFFSFHLPKNLPVSGGRVDPNGNVGAMLQS